MVDFTKIATEFGVAIALLVALLYALYRTGMWLASNVVKPLADRHMVFIERIEKVQLEQAATLQEIAKTQEKQTDIQREEIEQLKAIQRIASETLNNMVEEWQNAMKELREDNAQILKCLSEFTKVRES